MFVTSNAFHGKILERIRAFSDGVFSIVLTVLVLDLRSPMAHGLEPRTDEVLLDKLVELWPSYLRFVN